MTEAPFFKRFIEYLNGKPDSEVFNVPRGTIERIRTNVSNGIGFYRTGLTVVQFTRRFDVSTFEKSERESKPFFVIDTFDTSQNSKYLATAESPTEKNRKYSKEI